MYLKGRVDGLDAAVLEALVRRWYMVSVLTGEYSGRPEIAFDDDIRQIEVVGLEKHIKVTMRNELSESFWSCFLPQQMVASSENTYFLIYKAAQIKIRDRSSLLRDITVRDLIPNRSEVHRLYPKNYLRRKGLRNMKSTFILRRKTESTRSELAMINLHASKMNQTYAFM